MTILALAVYLAPNAAFRLNKPRNASSQLLRVKERPIPDSDITLIIRSDLGLLLLAARAILEARFRGSSQRRLFVVGQMKIAGHSRRVSARLHRCECSPLAKLAFAESRRGFHAVGGTWPKGGRLLSISLP